MKSILSKKKAILATLFLTLCLSFAAHAAEPVKVAVIPFGINAEKDYTFLQKGIVQMLTSRLAVPGKVKVIDPIETEKALSTASKAGSPDAVAKRVGSALKADYAVYGSLTVLGESVSIDAKMVDIAKKSAPYTFYKQTDSLGDVISQIDLMAAEINSSFFGAPAKAATSASPAGTGAKATGAVSAVTAVTAGVAGTPATPQQDFHMHPEKLLQQRQAESPSTAGTASPIAGAQARQVSPLNPAFQKVQEAPQENAASFWRSRTYDHLINGIDVADVDNDGLLETVVATPESIYIYRFAQGRQQTVAKIDTGRNVRNISVSIGDINGNGTPELFITSFTLALDVLDASVMEYDGRKFQTIASKQRLFFSVVHHPVRGALLLGQSKTGDDNVHAAPIYEMKWNGAEYMKAQQLLAGRKANVLGLAYGHIIGKTEDSFVALDWLDHLRVFQSNGKELWKSNDTYGGTTLYFAMQPKDSTQLEDPSYLPIRIRAVDLDGNGKPEILTASNQGSIGRNLRQQRHFNKSHIEALEWQTSGLVSTWKTTKLSGGRIQDLNVSDFDNDGTVELLAAYVTKEGTIIFTDAESSLIAYDLKTP